MKIQIKEKKESGKIIYLVRGEATIYSAGDLKDSLLDVMKVSGDKIVDLSGVDKMDTAGFQLFHLMKRDMAAAGNALVFCNPSDEVKTVFDTYGEEYQ